MLDKWACSLADLKPLCVYTEYVISKSADLAPDLLFYFIVLSYLKYKVFTIHDAKTCTK